MAKDRTQSDVNSATADDEEEEGDIAAWARPAYARVYSDYLLSGARYGHTDEGMRRWMSEQIDKQRRAAAKARRTR